MIELMLLGVVLGVFLLGHRSARAGGASQVMSFATGIAYVVAIFVTLVIVGSIFAAVVSRGNRRRDFGDSLMGFLAASIVLLWFLLVIGYIIAIVSKLFASLLGFFH